MPFTSTASDWLLGISWQDHITNAEVLWRTGLPSMYSWLTRWLCWLGHVFIDQIWGARHRDGANRMTYKDVCKRDLKICSIIPGNLESTAANDVGIRLSRSAPSKLRWRGRNSGRRRLARIKDFSSHFFRCRFPIVLQDRPGQPTNQPCQPVKKVGAWIFLEYQNFIYFLSQHVPIRLVTIQKGLSCLDE